MLKLTITLAFIVLLTSCSTQENENLIPYENPEIQFDIPPGFPALNSAINDNRPTKYGVALGEKLFHEKKFSGNNTISCASCHHQAHAFADNNKQAIGIYDRVGLRNTPPIQNLAFIKCYNWDGNKLTLESQPLVPIITHEEMNSSILEVMTKLDADESYRFLFQKAFGDMQITPDRIYRSLAQYEYTLISANSKYDRVTQHRTATFTESERRGYTVFNAKCSTCHSTSLFTDQSFRNVGFPINPSTEEAGRARITGKAEDFMRFRVPSLRNAEFTAPYGSFGQFPTLRAVLDYFDKGVLAADNLDPILKDNGNRIPLSEQEKDDIIAFIKTLNDSTFIGK
ncbi:cytochrome-c peroxidase [Sphingobacterium psychroaquaticum]|uniref:cytochrome-c peroxidase n=1 Tax=Sphingobacterium psychroaquaticum TaxID=561061 RepID=UPI00106D5091|nr:cytochrome c peroxidase [Sphingobacterium psychroaquaticum]QBQ41366.1 cytochrome-c peroxidase [Sphingobacterium psychroaquaticum]